MMCFCRARWSKNCMKMFSSKRKRATCPVCHRFKASGFQDPK